MCVCERERERRKYITRDLRAKKFEAPIGKRKPCMVSQKRKQENSQTIVGLRVQSRRAWEQEEKEFFREGFWAPPRVGVSLRLD